MLEIDYQDLVKLLPVWGYITMFVLMIIEGPIVTMAGAFLSSLDYFNFFTVLVLSILGDIVGDTILYYFGFWGGRRLLKKIQNKFKVSKDLIDKLENIFIKKGAKIIFYVKITTGLCWVTFFLAGVARMKFRQFIFYSFLGGIFWSLLLTLVGYFFGYAAEEVNGYFKHAGKIFFGLAIFFVFILGWIRKKEARKIIS